MEDKTIKKFYKCHSQLSSVYGYISAILKDRDITDEERKDFSIVVLVCTIPDMSVRMGIEGAKSKFVF